MTMRATIPNSKPLDAAIPTGNGRQDKPPAHPPKAVRRWRFSPPSNTALILLALRVLINALALVVAIIVTPGISLDYPNPQLPLTIGLIILVIAFGILNTFVRPLLLLLTGRLAVRTMGLFLFVNQLLLFLIVDWLFAPFAVQGPRILWFGIASVITSGLVAVTE